MELRDRANKIAMQAIAANSQPGLRAGSLVMQEQRTADCLDQLTTLLGAELDGRELLSFAATETYRANFFLHGLRFYEDSIDDFMTAIAETPTRARSKARIIKAALAKLSRRGHPLVSVLVEGAQGIAPTLKASANADEGKATTRKVKAYAIKLYDARTWKNPSQARHQLLDKVKTEAKRLDWVMSDAEAPITLYRWFREHKKSMRSTS